MTKTFISARWLLVGLLGLGLWLSPGTTYGQSQELVEAANQYVALYRQGRYEEALPFAQKAVRLGEQEFGANDPTFATLINNLAELCRNRGSYAEAEPLYQRAQAILEAALGPEHPRVARGLTNLAVLFCDQGRYAEAEPLCEGDLAIAEKALGADYPGVTTGLANLALLYRMAWP